jgi:glycosyltransferase involved in cell wall biosynthesis
VTPSVSVITIFLNAEKFLKESLDSVFSQTFDEWELILIDDGSTDRSSEVAREIALQNPQKIRYFEHEGHANLGMSASRNLGIAQAKAPLIALLDSDDAWFSTKLEEQIALLRENPEAQMIYGNNQFWKSWTGNPKDADYQMDLGVKADRIFYVPELLKIYFESKKITAPVPSDLMFRREMAIRRSFENSFRNMFEDQIFLIKVFAHEPVYVSSSCWTRYRQHAESFTTKWRDISKADDKIPIALRWAEDYLGTQGFRGTQSWKKLQQILFRWRHPLLFRIKQKFK